VAPRVVQEVQDWLLVQAGAGVYPTLREVALRFGCTQMTVSRGRRALIEAGLLPEPPRSAQAGKTRGRLTKGETTLPHMAEVVEAVASPDLPSVEEELARATGRGILSTDEQREKLSYLAENAMREEVRISALSTLARLDAMAGAQRQKGRVDLTEEERHAHTVLLLQALGQQASRRALEEAFPLVGTA